MSAPGLAIAAAVVLTATLAGGPVHAAGAQAVGTSVAVSAGGQTVTLYVEERGKGPPLLLLHGLGGSTFTWRNVAPALARNRRVIALDLKGFGRSAKPADDRYAAEDQAALVAAFIDMQGLSRVTIVGHSFGGTVAAETARLLGRSRVDKLVLVAAPLLPGALAQSYDFVLVPGAAEALVSQMGERNLVRYMLEAARGRRGVSTADVEGYAAPYEQPEARRAFVATVRAMIARDRRPPVALSTLDMPTLLVWCKADDIVPASGARKLAAALPSAQLVALGGCNHLPQDQSPKQLVGTIERFLGR